MIFRTSSGRSAGITDVLVKDARLALALYAEAWEVCLFASHKIALFGVASILSATHVLSAAAQEARAVSNPPAYILEPVVKGRAQLESFAQDRATAEEDGAFGFPIAYPGTHHMPAAWRAKRVLALAGTIGGSGDGILGQHSARLVQQAQLLLGNGDINEHVI